MQPLRRAALAAALSLAATMAAAQHDQGDVLAETGNLVIRDGYARATGATARTGAGYLVITNTGTGDDRLLEARSDVSARVELHTTDLADGVARMREMTDGIPIPSGETVVLERGGMHVMFMGLNTALEQGDGVAITLVFESAGEVEMDLPVDLERDDGAPGNHGDMDHGADG